MSRSTLQREPTPWANKPEGRCEVDNVNGCAYVEGYSRVRSSWQDAKTQDYRSEKLGNRKMPSK